MQQRRVRLGDILDDYCPRERRITNHAVVAMIEDAVKQTRCTTCDADHEYKGGKLPAHRRRKPEGALVSDSETQSRPELVSAEVPVADESVPADPVETAVVAEASAPEADAAATEIEAESEAEEPSSAEDEWVHRPLIRATLPRPEGHVPERKEPDFTMRSTGGRFDGSRGGQRHNRGQRQQRQGQGQFGGGGQRQGAAGQQGERNGNRAPQPGGHRGGRPGGGQRQGGGHGRGPKRGR
jgi:hypothetical protein